MLIQPPNLAGSSSNLPTIKIILEVSNSRAILTLHTVARLLKSKVSVLPWHLPIAIVTAMITTFPLPWSPPFHCPWSPPFHCHGHHISIAMVTTFPLPWSPSFHCHGHHLSIAMVTTFPLPWSPSFHCHGHHLSIAMVMYPPSFQEAAAVLDPKTFPPLLETDDTSSKKLEKFYKAPTTELIAYLDFSVSTTGILSGVKVGVSRIPSPPPSSSS